MMKATLSIGILVTTLSASTLASATTTSENGTAIRPFRWIDDEVIFDFLVNEVLFPAGDPDEVLVASSVEAMSLPWAIERRLVDPGWERTFDKLIDLTVRTIESKIVFSNDLIEIFAPESRKLELKRLADQAFQQKRRHIQRLRSHQRTTKFWSGLAASAARRQWSHRRAAQHGAGFEK